MTKHSVKVRWLIDEERNPTAAGPPASHRGATARPRKPRTLGEWLGRCRELAASEEDAIAIAKACYRVERIGNSSLASPVHQACLHYKQECWCRVCDPGGDRWRQRQMTQDLDAAGFRSARFEIPAVLAEWIKRCRPFARNDDDALEIARMCCEEERRGFLGYASALHQSASFYGRRCICRLCDPTGHLSWRERLLYRLKRSALGRLFPHAEPGAQ
jgi:hypothetical protein